MVSVIPCPSTFLMSRSETPLCPENWKTRILTHLPLGPLDVSVFLCKGFCHKIRHVFRPHVNCSNQCRISKGQSGSLVGRFIWLVFWPWPHTIREKERNSEWRNSFWEAGLCTCCGDMGPAKTSEACFTAELKIIKCNTGQPRHSL